ncbi:MAG: hypothetical protein ABJC09_12300, partial [Terriglobia bacterium]
MRLAAAIFSLIPLVPGLSQTDRDALRLLREVNATARTVKSWRAEGVEVNLSTTVQKEVRRESHFVIAAQHPLKMRQEHTGDEHTLAVCDGAEVFYWGGGTNFYRSAATVEKGCGFSLTDFYQLEESPA